MAIEQKLQLKLSQKLVMTPSLQQAIKLLQMTRMELRQTVSEELVENPILEEIDELSEESVDEDASDQQEAEDAEADDELDHDEAMEEIELEEYFDDYYDGSTAPRVSEERKAPPIENTLSREPDLYDHLIWQLHMSDIHDREREIGELIIGNLDEDGFLQASIDEIVELGPEDSEDEPFEGEQVERTLRRVQAFDPPGVACRDVQESLLVQLDLAGESEDSVARRIVRDHWQAFLKRRFSAIAKELEIELSELEPTVEEIKRLETRPGRAYSSERPHYVEPDVQVLRIGGEYKVQLNDDGMPRLRISRAYRNMLRQARQDGSMKDTRKYLKEKLRSATWLIKSIDQRQRTIYKVANSILQQQQGYFEHGVEHLKPMILRDVAEDIEMHESTVSRVVSNKYMHTPRGTLPMKFFFHSGLDRAYGEDISSLTVKKRIRELIDSEDAKKPFSDSALARALKREGISIARRTVAKYRDEMQLPASPERKQIF